MFKGGIYLCERENFKFEDFYNIIDGFKHDSKLILEYLYGKDVEINYWFLANEKKRVIIKFNNRGMKLFIEIETSNSLEDFNTYYEILQKDIDFVYKK
jgi:hypothetical protein